MNGNMTPSRLIASLLGVGFLRPAPGTWGSLVVLPAVLLGPVACLLLALSFFVIGVWAVSRLRAEDDPGWVVIDEGSGMCLALAAIAVHPTVFLTFLAFAFFRLLDIVKPWPIHWADRQKGAFWVMFDDVLAGAIAAALLVALSYSGWLA